MQLLTQVRAPRSSPATLIENRGLVVIQNHLNVVFTLSH
jgi:hypothetical protein